MKVVRTVLISAVFALASSGAMAQLRLGVQAADPLRPVMGNLVLQVHSQADECYDIVDGVKVKVPCPDVIVAVPDTGRAHTSDAIAGLISRNQTVARSAVRSLAAEVPIAEGTYNCYKEDPPGHFTPVRCPDIIILDTND